MGRRLSIIYRAAAIVLIFTIIYNEFIIYNINTWTWQELKCKEKKNCLKILLVADPQLIGEKNEIYHYITPISIWDSDRFLRKTYSAVVDHLSPDVIIFLGDLFDEGSVANTVQYVRYLKRLFSIFTTEYPITHIWLPGDNDIGGETDRVTEAKIKRFEDSFAQSPIVEVKNVIFSKVNRMVNDKPKSFDMIKQYKNEEKLSVVVSHMPLILSTANIVDQVIEVLKPRLIFAAHEHKARVVRTDVEQNYRKVDDIIAPTSEIYGYQLEKDKIIELLVPTCSYRMGTHNIGYGAVVIENDSSIQYTVFWSPKRFTYLKAYVVVLALITVAILLHYLCRKIFKPRIIFMYKRHYPYRIIKNGV